MPASRTKSPATLKATMRRVRLAKRPRARKLRKAISRVPSAATRRERSPSSGEAAGRNAGSSSVSLRASSSVRLAMRFSPTLNRNFPSGFHRSGRMSAFPVAIADAIKRFDCVEGVIDFLEFLAQALDVAVDGAVIYIDLVVIGGIHQRIPALHIAGALGERLKDQKFRHGQHNLLAVPCAGMTLRIEHQLATLQNLVRRAFGSGTFRLGRHAAEHRLHALDKQALR